VVKNIYLTGERKFSRKIVEALTALRLEKKLSKRQILDYYINIAEFGPGIYGIKSASAFYFDKQPDELTAQEAAILAVILPKPKARGRALMEQDEEDFQPKRVKNLLARMKQQGYIS
jgi:monofunctional biosynthetic peptidoglycan transglycosylase